MVELYNWQRFFQEDLLIEKGILNLNDWLALFANVTVVWELPPEGLDENGAGFRQINRVSSFKNVPELMKMVLQFLDCVTRDEIDMDTPDIIRKTVNCQPTVYQKDYMKTLVERANRIRKGKVASTVDNMLKVTMDGRKSALDIRIVNPHAPDRKTSKVSECAANILEIYNKYAFIHGTQVVFSDISTPNQTDFNVYSALKKKLVSMGFGHRIYKTYGDESIAMIRDNPYKLADDVWSIGFKTADAIAGKLGMEKESFPRCRSGIFYILGQFSNEGHCYAPIDELVKKSVEMLDIEEPKIVITADHFIREQELIREQGDKIYLPPFFHAEMGTARRIKAIMQAPNPNMITDIDAALVRIQRDAGITYDEVQINAVKLAVASKFSVMTGGPGTGKTTTTKAIINLFFQAGKQRQRKRQLGKSIERLNKTLWIHYIVVKAIVRKVISICNHPAPYHPASP